MRKCVAALLACLLLSACLGGCAEGAAEISPRAGDAPDVTARCTLRATPGGQGLKALRDGTYEYPWKSARKRKVWLEVTLPEDERCSGVAVKWALLNASWRVEVPDGAGGWTLAAEGDHERLHTYTPLPEVSAFRIIADQRVSDCFNINEITVLGRGAKPAWVQDWRPTVEKADLLVVVAHPDDEYVFMGGLIPYYAGERGLRVAVAYVTESSYQRRSELLDGLWAAGVRDYPLPGRFHDRFTYNLGEAYKRLGKKRVRGYFVELLRRLRPEVVVTHDLEGEYGHGVHKVAADAILYAVDKAADPKFDPDSAARYGAWSVPKVYLHLYPENRIRMDWDAPLAAFGGRSAYDVADQAFLCHVSQQHTVYKVYRDGPYDGSLFGLARSLVGPDEAGGDLFEHLTTLGPAD